MGVAASTILFPATLSCAGAPPRAVARYAGGSSVCAGPGDDGSGRIPLGEQSAFPGVLGHAGADAGLGLSERLVLSGLELELLLPEHVSARASTPARLRIRNLKRLTPSFSIELAGRRDPLTAMPSILTGPVYFPLIPGGGVIEAAIPVTFHDAGGIAKTCS